MQNAHDARELGSPDRSAIRTGFGWALVAIAVPLTVFFGWGVFDGLTGDYIGDEVAMVWVVLGAVGVLTAFAWIGAVALIKSGHDLSRRSHLVSTGLILALLGSIAVVVVPTTAPMLIVLLSAVAVGLVTAAVGAIRA